MQFALDNQQPTCQDTRMKLIYPSQFKPLWEYKYVRFDDDTILFCDACDCNASHKGIIDADQCSAKPISAGKIHVRYGKWCFSDYGSSTVHLEWEEHDEVILNILLSGKGLEYDHDIRY